MQLKLSLVRYYFKPDHVIGKLYNGESTICDTLEPNPNCIPTGEWSLSISQSPKFEKYMVHLDNVTGRTGILIHAGNTPKDTTGCILVGDNSKPGELVNSSFYENKVFMLVRGFSSAIIEVKKEA